MRAQRGFTLIELMISLVLFSFAIAGALSIAVTLTNGYREQRQAIETEQSVRAPMDYLTDAIRNSSPAMPGATCLGAPPTYMPQAGCNTVAPATSILEVMSSSCTATGVPAIWTTNSATAADTLDVIYAAGGFVTSLASGYTTNTDTTISVWNASGILPGDTLLVVNTVDASSTPKAALVHVSSTWTNPNTACGTAPAALCATAVTLDSPLCGTTDALPLYSLVVRAYHAHFYIDTTNYANPQGDVIPTLMMDPNIPGQPAEPLAENIEDMQVALGIDADQNGAISANEWAYSATTPGALSGTLRAVRITLTARAPQQLIGYAAQHAFFRRVAEDYPADTGGDAWRRRVLTSTVEVRNSGGSP
jgi:prepilin-type N-terminal cleavage/methylation domain-containing protein